MKDLSLLSQKFWQEMNQDLPKKYGDSDLLRTYAFQKKRLKEEGLELCTTVTSRGLMPEGRVVISWKDLHYKTSAVVSTALYQRDFYQEGSTKPLKTDSDAYTLYTDVTECCDYNISGKDAYVCPNCGAVSTLDELQHKGCSYCGTRFAISELYPRVSGYYAVKDPSGTSKELNSEIMRFIFPFLVLALIFSAITIFSTFDQENIIGSILSDLFTIASSVAAAFIAGYFIWAFLKLGKLFFEAGKSLPKLPALGSQKKFAKKMQKYSEEFSYEYFTNKVVSILKTIIYSSKDEVLPNYTGQETRQFDHVVESSFSGALGLKSFKIENDIVTVKVYAYMENFYHENNRIKKKEEKIHLTVKKDLSVPMNYHFNIKAVKCPGCGGSFDALSNRFCPYCNTPLDMLKEDWVITDIE